MNIRKSRKMYQYNNVAFSMIIEKCISELFGVVEIPL